MAQQFNADLFTPLQKQSVIYSDFLTSFSPHPERHDLALKKNENSVVQSISNIMKTRKYSRKFNMKFGANIDNWLFEPITPATTAGLQTAILEAIQNYEPRAINVNVIATPYPDQSAYIISTTFYLVNSIASTTLNSILYRSN